MKHNNGFTLIELMVVIAIIGIIMAYAIPSYQRNVIVSKRTEAKSAILMIASEEEKHNASFNSYTLIINGSGVDGDSLGLGGAQFQSSVDYDFAITAPNGYTITATAKGNTQVKDNFSTDCRTLSLDSLGVKLPLNCWQ